jgi:integrase
MTSGTAFTQYSENRAQKVDFAQFVESWDPKVLPMWKPSASVTARQHIRKFLIPVFGQMGLQDINTEAVQGMIAGMVEHEASRSYVLNVLGTLNSILTSAALWGHRAQKLDYSRLAIPVQGEKQRGKTFTPDQAKAILNAAHEPERSLFVTAVMTGLRSGELAGLYWEDINFEEARLEVLRSCFRGKMNAVKSKSGNRTVPLPDALKAVLRAHQERTGHKTGLVFRGRDGGPIDINSWRQRRLVPLLEQLGIPRAGLHAFRHALASALVATGANPKVAQAQLGHSDIRQTLDLYTHIIGDEQREAVERAAESFIPTQSTAALEATEAARDFPLNVLLFTNKGRRIA